MTREDEPWPPAIWHIDFLETKLVRMEQNRTEWNGIEHNSLRSSKGGILLGSRGTR